MITADPFDEWRSRTLWRVRVSTRHLAGVRGPPESQRATLCTLVCPVPTSTFLESVRLGLFPPALD